MYATKNETQSAITEIVLMIRLLEERVSNLEDFLDKLELLTRKPE